MIDLQILQDEIENHFNLPRYYFWQTTQKREIVYYRHLFYYIRSKLMFNYSLRDVSNYIKKLGWKHQHHSTQLNSFKTVSNLYDTDKKVKNDVDILIEKLKHLRHIPMYKVTEVDKIEAQIQRYLKRIDELKEKKQEILGNN